MQTPTTKILKREHQHPCVVLIDPGTGMQTFAEEMQSQKTLLFVIETEVSQAYPDYFPSEHKHKATRLIQCERSRVPELLTELARNTSLAKVVAGDELSLALAEKAAQMIGADGNDPATSDSRHSKFKMNEWLRQSGKYTPKQKLFNLQDISVNRLSLLLCDFEFPIIIKPNKAAGSMCTYKCETKDKLEACITRVKEEYEQHTISPISTEFLAQEFVDGREFLVNSFSAQGHHYVSGVFNYTKYLRDGTPIFQSVNFDGVGDHEERVCEYVLSCLDILGNREGLVNTDLICGTKGIALLEINCRIVGFGGWLSRLEKHLFGANQATLLARCVNQEAPLPGRVPRGHPGKLVMLQSTVARPMHEPADTWLRALPSYLEHGWNKVPGDPLRVSRSLLSDTVGNLLLSHESKEQLEEDFQRVIERQDAGGLF